MDLENRLLVAKVDGEGVGWTGSLWLIDANYCIWSGKKWDTATYHRELYLVTCDGTWWMIIWEKECIYAYIFIYMTGSICCTVEIDGSL